MNIEALFSGIGVVIDDKIFAQKGDDKIVDIVEQLEKDNHFPLVKYDELPSEDLVTKLNCASFVLLDWEVISPLTVNGIPLPVSSELKKESRNSAIRLVRLILNEGIAPVFIFSNEDPGEIYNSLSSAGIDMNTAPVLIKSKSDLIGDNRLFEEIGKWVDNHSGVYVTREWENSFQEAKMQFYTEMANNSHWPLALLNAADKDSVDPANEIIQAISTNIISRMPIASISADQIKKDPNTPSTEEVLSIMKGQFFMDGNKDESRVGDFYCITNNGSVQYFVNVRPSCDCIERDGNSGEVYLLECKEVSEQEQTRNSFRDTVGMVAVAPLYDCKFFKVILKQLSIRSYEDIKQYKVGRILHPLVSHITEQFGAFIHRQACPRLPEEILPEKKKKDKAQECKVDKSVADKRPRGLTLLIVILIALLCAAIIIIAFLVFGNRIPVDV